VVSGTHAGPDGIGVERTAFSTLYSYRKYARMVAPWGGEHHLCWLNYANWRGDCAPLRVLCARRAVNRTWNSRAGAGKTPGLFV